jgi:hypothetical protein
MISVWFLLIPAVLVVILCGWIWVLFDEAKTFELPRIEYIYRPIKYVICHPDILLDTQAKQMLQDYEQIFGKDNVVIQSQCGGSFTIMYFENGTATTRGVH